MSNWTHVAAIIRIDSFNHDFDAENHFGKECLFRSPRKVWDDYEKNPDKYLPMGWEGSLKMSVWVNPDSDHLAAYTVSIFGDLRGDDDPNAIVKWFQGKLKGLMVRQATITAENEYNGTVNWTYLYKDED